MAPKQPEFVGFAISPFSLKARWALEVLGVDFKQTHYTPAPFYLAELPLRLRMRKPTGRISAPILFSNDGSGVIMDSFKIMEWGMKKAPEKATLAVPEGQLEEVAKWNKLADDVLHFYRTCLCDALMNDQEARASMGGGPDNAATDKMLIGLGRRLAAKYTEDKDFSNDMAKAALQELRSALQANGLSATNADAYTLGTFSYADIAMAVTVDMLTPPSGLPKSVANPLATHIAPIKALAEEFADLVAWREAVWRKHMPAAPAAGAPKEPAATEPAAAASAPAAAEPVAPEPAADVPAAAAAEAVTAAEPVTAAETPAAAAETAAVAPAASEPVAAAETPAAAAETAAAAPAASEPVAAAETPAAAAETAAAAPAASEPVAAAEPAAATT